MSDFDTRHAVAESITRMGADTAGICYQIMLLGLMSKTPQRLKLQLTQLNALQVLGHTSTHAIYEHIIHVLMCRINTSI